MEERLLNPNQSGFRQSYSCINQLLAITHEIFEAFVCNPTLVVRSVFLDISKAFDKVWHEGLFFKLRSMGISGKLYNLLGNSLSDKFQRIILNRQTSSWRPVIAGILQALILGQLLFLDLPKELESSVKLFADDTSLFTIVRDKNGRANTLNNDLLLISKWAYNWKILSIYTTFNRQTNSFKYSFFTSTLNEWFNLDLNIRNSESISIFKSKLLPFIRPVQTNIYNIFGPKGLTFLTCLRLGLIHLNEHRLGHNFQDCLNSLCSCSLEIQDTSHYLLHWHHFPYHRAALMNSVKSICGNFDSMSDNVKEDLLLYGDSRFDENKNKLF